MEILNLHKQTLSMLIIGAVLGSSAFALTEPMPNGGSGVIRKMIPNKVKAPRAEQSSSAEEKLVLPTYVDPNANTRKHNHLKRNVRLGDTCTDKSGSIYEPKDPGYERCSEEMNSTGLKTHE